MNDPLLKGLTLRGLAVFETIARTGSVADTAKSLNMSAPAVSQQLKNLSAVLGVDVIDHSRRPMALTPAGRLFLGQAQIALKALRQGQRGLNTLDLSGLSALSLGVIEDFETGVTPLLATQLAQTMSHCSLRMITGASHILHTKIMRRELDIAICATNTTETANTKTLPLLEDPYILAVPKGTDISGGFGMLQNMVFLRRDIEQIMGQQIETYLGQMGVNPPARFEMDSNQSISALVADGLGWTITTALSHLRAGRFADSIDVHPLPHPPSPRKIVLYASDDWTLDIPEQVAELARTLIAEHFIAPAQDDMPWLNGALHIAP